MSYRYVERTESQSPERPTNEYEDDMDEMAETSSFVREMLEGEGMPFMTHRFNSSSDGMRYSTPQTNRSLVINEPSDKYVPVRDTEFSKKKGSVREGFFSQRVNDEKARIPREVFHEGKSGSKSDKNYETSQNKPGKYSEKSFPQAYEPTSTRDLKEDDRERRLETEETSSFQSPILPHEALPPPLIDCSSVPRLVEPNISQRRTSTRTAGNRDLYKNEQFIVTGTKHTSRSLSSQKYKIKTCISCRLEFSTDKTSSLIRCPHCSIVQMNDTCGSRTIISTNEEQVNEKECCIFQRKYLTAPNQQPSNTAGMDSESISCVEKYFREDSSRVCRGCYQFYGHKYGGNRLM